ERGRRLPRAADERFRLNGQVRGVERAQRRERFGSDLESPLGCCEVLHPMPPEISDGACFGDYTCPFGKHDLAAVCDACDPRRSVHVEAHIPLVRHERLAGVEAYADADRAAVERPLAFGGGRESVFRARKSDEEGVALGVDLDAAVAGEGLPEDAPVLRQRVGVGVAELVQQACRALDVGEEEGDGAGRELAHLSRAANASETASSMDSNLPPARRASNRSSARRERSSLSSWSATARAYVSRF